ncbi:MAG: GNAT family N-acetyltransferase [Oscillospiraceae bacterium]|nr:GNAT family N-acetyltransferase [Oscillospiraceae bacterium]
MTDVYEHCPGFECERFSLRLIRADDCSDLLKVYSDERAVPLFNSDNCNGDDFHYTTAERMKQAIDFWKFSYDNRYFVRWTITDKENNEAIGTIELFHRDSDDFFDNCGVLRLDLRSDYETNCCITEILSLFIVPASKLFYCDKIATKAVPQATERISALNGLGFVPCTHKLVGHDGTEYGDYYILMN